MNTSNQYLPWKFAEKITAKEAAQLIVGIPPLAFGDQHDTLIAPIIRSMSDAFYRAGTTIFSRYREGDDGYMYRIPDIPAGMPPSALPSTLVEALDKDRIMTMSRRDFWDQIHNHLDHEFHETTFSPGAINNWITANNYESAFNFATRQPVGVGTTVAESTSEDPTKVSEPDYGAEYKARKGVEEKWEYLSNLKKTLGTDAAVGAAVGISRQAVGAARRTWEEQNQANRLKEMTGHLEAMESEADSSITLLQERRSALISAAVTGQIDVRGLAARTVTLDLIAARADSTPTQGRFDSESTVRVA